MKSFLLAILTVLAFTVPNQLFAQNADLPENMVVFINERMGSSIPTRSILRSDLNGTQMDTLATRFGNILSLSYIPETNEYVVADNQQSRILHINSDLTNYKVVMTNRDLVYATAYDAERDRYFYTRIASSVATRGLFYMDGIDSTPQQLDNRSARYMTFHPDSNAVYYALSGVGVVKHQMDRDERTTLIPYTNVTTGMHLDRSRGHLYLVYANDLYRYDLNDADAEPEFLFVMGFGSQRETAMTMNDETQTIYISALSGLSRNIVYEVPIDDLDAEVEFQMPYSQQVELLVYNSTNNELIFTDGGHGAGNFAFLRGYNLETEKTANHSLRDVSGLALMPETGTIYALDRFFVQSDRTLLFSMDLYGRNREILQQFERAQRAIKADTVNNRLFIQGFSDDGSFDNIWVYDLNTENNAEPEVRLSFEKPFSGVQKMNAFDVDFEEDVIYVTIEGEGIFACPEDTESCTLIFEEGNDLSFGSSLAFNPVDERIYVTESIGGIVSVNTDGSDYSGFYSDFNPIYGMQYNSSMGKIVWATTPFSGSPSIRYRAPSAPEDVAAEIFFSGRDVRDMDFIIGNPATVSIDDDLLTSSLPEQITLRQNYPNPFNPTTSIRFELPEATEVRISVYDVTGRLIQVLDQGTRAAGAHSINFDASSLSSGVYLYRLETPQFSQTQKMTLIK